MAHGARRDDLFKDQRESEVSLEGFSLCNFNSVLHLGNSKSDFEKIHILFFKYKGCIWNIYFFSCQLFQTLSFWVWFFVKISSYSGLSIFHVWVKMQIALIWTYNLKNDSKQIYAANRLCFSHLNLTVNTTSF